MLRHRRSAHREFFRQLAHRLRTITEDLEERSPGRVGQGSKKIFVGLHYW